MHCTFICVVLCCLLVSCPYTGLFMSVMEVDTLLDVSISVLISSLSLLSLSLSLSLSQPLLLEACRRPTSMVDLHFLPDRLKLDVSQIHPTLAVAKPLVSRLCVCMYVYVSASTCTCTLSHICTCITLTANWCV